MWTTKGNSRTRSTVSLGMFLIVMAGGPVIAQDTAPVDPAATGRERELREQLKNILHELDEIQQQKERVTPEVERPSIIKEPTEAVSPEG